MKKKDPAFLFYSKDWLQGTAELTHVEKGVFIDLLCHQHQNGDLPADPKRLARLAGMGEVEFMEVWRVLSVKFPAVEVAIADANATPNADAIAGANAPRVANKKLVEVMSDRKDSAHKNKIISVWSHLLRNSDLSKSDLAKIKKEFKVNDFIKYSSEEVSERICEWWCDRTHSLGIAIAIENGNAIGNERGGVGEKTNPPSVPDVPAPYVGRKLKIPSQWPEQEFMVIWNEWRRYRKKQDNFIWKDEDSEQRAIDNLRSEAGTESLSWIIECVRFCKSNGWKRIIPEAYHKFLKKPKSETTHNEFSHKVKPL